MSNFKGDKKYILSSQKVVFTCKASDRDAVVGSAVTSVLPSWRSWSCSIEMETFGRFLGIPRPRLPLYHQRGNCYTVPASARLALVVMAHIIRTSRGEVLHRDLRS